LKGLADEVGPIVMNDPMWHTKAVNGVMFNKFNYVSAFTSLKGIASAHLEK